MRLDFTTLGRKDAGAHASLPDLVLRHAHVIAGERFAPDEALTTGVLSQGGIVMVDSATVKPVATTFEMADLMCILSSLRSAWLERKSS